MAYNDYFYGMEDTTEDVVPLTETIDIEDYSEDSETVDVSDISESQAAHNEAASAGGIVTGSNVDDITMDPVAATESYIRRRFGLSLEDLEEATEETLAEGEAVLAATPTEEEIVPSEDEAVGVTTVTVVPPEGGTTSVDDGVAPVIEDPVTQLPEEGAIVEAPIESTSDVASLENLRYILSREDDMEDGGTADVEFDVKTPNNDVNFQMEDKAITIEPNADSSTSMDTDSEEPVEEPNSNEEPTDETSEEQPTEEEGNEEPASEEEAGQESWFNFM